MNAKAAPAKINKSEEIRKLLDKGIDSPKEIVAALAERDISVTAQQVSGLKSKGGGTGVGNGKKKGGKAGPSFLTVLEIIDKAGGIKGIDAAIKAIEAAKESQALINSLGGAEAAKAIKEALQKAK